MKDEILFYERRNEVLFILSAAQKHINKPLTKTQIQKIIYLSNSLSLLKDFIIDYFDFKVWHNGPYSKQIQRTLNNLVGQRYINMTEYKIDITDSDQNDKAKYAISNEGENVVLKLLDVNTKKEEYEWIITITRLVSYYGMNNLVDIVYAEPTFKELKGSSNGFGMELQIYDQKKNALMRLAQEFQDIGKRDYGYTFEKPSDVLLALFDYMYSEIQ